MKRLDGNSILIIEGDKVYTEKLRQTFVNTGAQVAIVWSVTDAVKSLEIYDFDVVLCGYYLPDGLIHHVIDWSREHLKLLPVFVALGSSIPGDESLLRRHLISYIFSRSDDHLKIVDGIYGFLFDFNKFYESLLAVVEPRGINMELTVNTERMAVTPIEITQDGIFVALPNRFENGTFAHMNICLYENMKVESYTLIGSLGGKMLGGQLFKINESYRGTWHKLISRLEDRQMHITGFLRKVAGK